MAISVEEAGRRGGLATLRNKGMVFFSRIGREGQKVMRAHHPGMAKIWGSMGGRPRKPTLAEIMGERVDETERKEERTRLIQPSLPRPK